MPIYVYNYTDDRGNLTGETFETYQDMKDEPLTHDEAGRPCIKGVAPLSGALSQEYRKPIEMMSIAVNNLDEVREFQARNPGVEISDDPDNPAFGVPMARTRQEKLRILETEGFQEAN